MFLHVGNNKNIRTSSVIGIFDMDNTTIARQSRDFLAYAQKNNMVIDICDDLPKSYIVTNRNGDTKVYISSVSSRTIYKRAKSKHFADNEKTEFSMYIK